MKELRFRLDFPKLKTCFIAVLIICFGSSLYGQEVTIESEDGSKLVGVFVFSYDNQFTAVSDENGIISLTDQVRFPLNFTYVGYVQLAISKPELVDAKYKVVLKNDQLLLNEITLVGRTDMAKEDLAYETTTISAADIQLSAPQTSADALQSNAGVFIQKSQMGGGSPVVRGFEANKLLLVVDGVRLNNTIYRSGHLQNAITVDPAILESMEVIFGPGSLLYGSDALGGVIHFRSKDILLAEATEKPIDLGYYTRYGSSNNERTVHLDFTYKNRRWGSLSSISISDFDDLKIGANRAAKYQPEYGLRPWFVTPGNASETDRQAANENPNVLRSTGYTQYDFLQKFKFQLTDRLTLLWNNQFSTSSNIPRYDALTEISNGNPRYSSWEYGPQQRFLSSLNTKYITENNRVFDKVQWIVAYQNVNESRISSRFLSDLVAEQDEQLNILNTTLDFTKERGLHSFYYGVDANFNDLNSTAFEQRYGESSAVEGGLTRYPNTGQSLSSGAYVQYYYLSDSWYKINAGLRYDFNRVNIRFEQDDVFSWPSYFYDGVTNVNESLNGSVGFQAQLPRNIKIRSLIGTSFRAPNIDDIAKIRLNNDEISVPNDQLVPEKSVSGEIGIAYSTGKMNYSFTSFYTVLNDAIIRDNFALPSGETTFITEGDTFNIVANINAESAMIRGVSLSLEHKLRDDFVVEGSLNILNGVSQDSDGVDSPLAHVPPSYGRFFMSYLNKKLQVRAGANFNGFKPLDQYGGSVDNPEFATENGSESWYVINASASYTFHPLFSLRLGIDNIFDQFYVPFASAVPGAGRHISVMVSGTF